jgi:hypothetical protein
MHVEPYLYFNGRCEEAVQFYRQAVGADGIELLRFSDAPEPPPPSAIPPGYERKIMHGVMRIGDSTIMMSDGRGNSRQASRTRPHHHRPLRGGRRPRLPGARERWDRAGAPREDVLLAAVRDGDRSLRSLVAGAYAEYLRAG